MPQEEASGTSGQDVSRCPHCGCEKIRRMERVGFWQIKIRSYFGYFPWECMLCRKPFYLKQRLDKRHRHRSARPPS